MCKLQRKSEQMVNTAHVSSSNSSLSAQKKRQDERNLKTLRELSSLPANRFCFECGQRGPTYVNITNGSFCCTTCSGILRGLNPPHRVKSICMATFTNEEIERIRSLGNEENSHTWLGLYSGTPPKMTNKEEFTTFLIRKYEKKEWYVSRTELEEQERLLNQAKEVASQSGTSAKSTASSVSKPPDLDLFSNDPFNAFGTPVSRQTTQSPHESLFQPASHGVDNNLFTSSQVSSDPFASSAAVAKSSSTSNFDPFADFDAKFGELYLKNSSSSAPNTFGSPSQVQPSFPKSATITSSFPPTHSIPPTPVSANPFQPHPSSSSTSNRSESVPICSDLDNGDKYSALAELDQVL
ncbi:hypothetical protein KIN20_008372 [Parelaphostrongylus tenuis]|uniref:Arf-GAP domain-containing protein n=1 Tax=Parelaphostrongylus tenuis TaxID=148309 RepID=A0AAD5QHG2_PARTN|nr:hypothetical protein KIN20_008372 [Parelaphostrongylus tenuis]